MLISEIFEKNGIEEGVQRDFASAVTNAIETENTDDLKAFLKENFSEIEEYELLSEQVIKGVETKEIINEVVEEDERDKEIRALKEELQNTKNKLEEKEMNKCPDCGKELSEKKGRYVCEKCNKTYEMKDSKLKEIKENKTDFDKGVADFTNNEIDVNLMLESEDYRNGVASAKKEQDLPENKLRDEIKTVKKEISEEIASKFDEIKSLVESALKTVKENKDEDDDAVMTEEDVKQTALQLAMGQINEANDIPEEHKDLFEETFETAKKSVCNQKDAILSEAELNGVEKTLEFHLRGIEEGKAESFDELVSKLNEKKEDIKDFDDFVKSVAKYSSLYIEEGIEILDDEDDDSEENIDEEATEFINNIKKDLTETQKIDLDNVIEGIEFEDDEDFRKQINEWVGSLDGEDDEDDKYKDLRSRYAKSLGHK